MGAAGVNGSCVDGLAQVRASPRLRTFGQRAEFVATAGSPFAALGPKQGRTARSELGTKLAQRRVSFAPPKLLSRRG
eukprot:5527620-Alexandrium_andersonii.AAC.1